jgi:hypothetical protein
MLLQELESLINELIEKENFPVPDIYRNLVASYSGLETDEINRLYYKLCYLLEKHFSSTGIILPLLEIAKLLYLRMIDEIEIESFEEQTFAAIGTKKVGEKDKFSIAFNQKFFEEILKGKDITPKQYLSEMNKLLKHEFGHITYKHIDINYIEKMFKGYAYDRIKNEIGENSAKIIEYIYKNKIEFIHYIINIIGDLRINYENNLTSIFDVPILHPDDEDIREAFKVFEEEFDRKVNDDKEFRKRIPAELNLDVDALRNELLSKLKDKVLGIKIRDERIRGILDRIKSEHSDLEEHYYDIFLFALFAYFIVEFVRERVKPRDKIEPGKCDCDELERKIKITEQKVNAAGRASVKKPTPIEIEPVKVFLPLARIELYAVDEVKYYKRTIKKRTYRRVREYPGNVEIPLRLRQRLKFLYVIVDTSGSVMDKKSLSLISGSIATLSQNYYIFLCIFSDNAYEFDLGKALERMTIRSYFKKFEVYSGGTQLSSALNLMIKRKVKKGVVISDFYLADKDKCERMILENQLKLFGIIINNDEGRNQAIETAKRIGINNYIFINVNDLK